MEEILYWVAIGTMLVANVTMGAVIGYLSDISKRAENK